ncbi:hypothetical protein [Amycolatopsis sp. NPDC004079]|uniref:hypothetical protein n=1 Tax=Amycolatopsis sp. NPDC004079 TaxID=3154549 RepID=UPI0033AE5B12
MSCKLWVQSADWQATVRADRIIGLRVAAAPGTGELYGPFRLEAVTPDPVGEHGATVVRLCSGRAETFPEDAAQDLARLIAQHIDDPDGGLVFCSDDDTTQDLKVKLFEFRSFAERTGPRPVR